MLRLFSMAKAIGKQEANEVSSRLTNPNMSFDKAVEMLSVLGYEVVIQSVDRVPEGQSRV